ncbi:HMG-box domain [Rhizoctonia solani]|uniref:HMG-box domain n=1 Tax=Rhizoctonia solani TaxID=456999 RepID=A0A8H7I655_9AGAM|nr:HMG-box domain [Rhizoctonia solani]
MSKVLPVTDIPPRRTSEPSDDSLDDASDNDALITQALNPDGTPRRPMNAFMIFARRRRPEITANNPPLRTGEISKVLSSEWAAMSSESKQFYLDRARKLKDNFNARWPDYVYRRRPNNSRKRKRPDVPSSAHPAVRRTSPGYEPVVPSSKVKYEDGYQHPLLPSLPSTNAPLTMPPIIAEQPPVTRIQHSDVGLCISEIRLWLAPLSLQRTDRYDEQPSEPSTRRLERCSALPESSAAVFSSPYTSYLPNRSTGSFDDYASSRDPDRHNDWTPTPPHAVRNSLALPAFTSNQSFPSFGPDDQQPPSSSSDFHAFQPDYPPPSGLVPVHLTFSAPDSI